jgi:hypothetical protein
LDRKSVIISGFLVFGVAVGAFNAWMTNSYRYDTPLLLNIPGELITRSVLSSKSLAAYVFGSALFWGVTSLLLSIVFKPKIIAWIICIYLLIFGD